MPAPHADRVENKPNQAFFFTAFLDCLCKIQLHRQSATQCNPLVLRKWHSHKVDIARVPWQKMYERFDSYSLHCHRTFPPDWRYADLVDEKS
jgi:hypothetical protein